jgi:nucleoside-diphosphate-sugar epimerase
MVNPAAKSQRFLAVAGKFMTIEEIARVLRANMGELAKRVPTRVLPNWLLRIAAMRDRTVKQIVSELGKMKSASNEKATRTLGWAPRSNEDAIVAAAESLVRLGLLKDFRETA